MARTSIVVLSLVVALSLATCNGCRKKVPTGPNPLHGAALHGELKQVKALVENGADVNGRDAVGMTPLHLAALHGHVEVARYLLDHGADVNAKDGGGTTPLQLALLGGYPDVPNLLREHGAR